SERDDAVQAVFETKAQELDASIRFASDELTVVSSRRSDQGLHVVVSDKFGETSEWEMQLSGLYQQKNLLGILTTIDQLRKQGFVITSDHVRKGLLHVVENTGIQGRWQMIGTNPLII